MQLHSKGLAQYIRNHKHLHLGMLTVRSGPTRPWSSPRDRFWTGPHRTVSPIRRSYKKIHSAGQNYSSVALHNSKKGNFYFRENWNLLLHKVTQISKKGNFEILLIPVEIMRSNKLTLKFFLWDRGPDHGPIGPIGPGPRSGPGPWTDEDRTETDRTGPLTSLII